MDMGKIQMKGATAVGSELLCRTCIHGLVLRGYRESEQMVRCTFANPAFVVPFPVAECTEYYDRNRPSWDSMQKLAVKVTANPKMKPVGFRVGLQVEENEEESSDDAADNN
jgi:hypothetical protein